VDWIIDLNNANRVTIQRVDIHDASTACVHYQGACSHITVEDCRFEEMGGYGITGQANPPANVEYFKFSRNIITTSNGSPNTAVGIYAVGGRHGAIMENVVDGVTGQYINGIILSQCQHVKVIGNTSRRNRDDGVTLTRNCEHIVIQGNTLTESTATGGIFVYDDTGQGHAPHRHISIMGNVLDGNGTGPDGGQGIAIQGGIADTVISGNTVCHNTDGIWVYIGAPNVTNVSIVNNVISYNKKGGIMLHGGTAFMVAGNTCRNNGQDTVGWASRDGIFVNSPNNCVISDNACFDDQATPTQGHGIKVRNSKGHSIKGNRIKGNREHGIFVEATSDCLIHDNRIEGNGFGGSNYSGIQVVGASPQNSLQGNYIRQGTAPAQHRAGISIHSGVSKTLVLGNDLLTSGRVTLLEDAGTQTVKKHNRGLDI
jgi:parallel beta-helix repeat protein